MSGNIYRVHRVVIDWTAVRIGPPISTASGAGFDAGRLLVFAHSISARIKGSGSNGAGLGELKQNAPAPLMVLTIHQRARN